MPKFKAKNKNAKLIVRVKLLRGEVLAERDLSMIVQRAVRGLLKPATIKPNVLEYTGPQGICLLDYLKQPLTEYEFHYIMAQIVRLERKLTANGLAIKHLIVDMQYVYINPFTKELQFVYLPLSTGFPCVVIRDYMVAIAHMWKPSPEEDTQYVERFISLLRGQQIYEPEQILSYIKQYDRRVAEKLRKSQTSMSGFITNKQADYYSHYGVSGTPGTELLPENNRDTELLPDQNYGTELLPNDDRDTELLQGNERDTELLVDPDEKGSMRWYGEETGLLTDESQDDTALLRSSPEPWPPQEQTFPQWQEETGLLTDQQYGQTELIADQPSPSWDGGETGLLTETLEPPHPQTHPAYPYMIRKSTNETIQIDKPVFRIGKERSYVDCFIANNNAISRSHADIIHRRSHYYICDRNSTNKTYRNGERLTPEEEVEIFDGDVLMLANEEFEFHTS